MPSQIDVLVPVARGLKVQLTDSQRVTGRWDQQVRQVSALKDGLRLAEEFVNLDLENHDAILAWTQANGPLRYPPKRIDWSLAGYALGIQHGKKFDGFTVERWQQDQANLRSTWEGKCGIGPQAALWKGLRKGLISHRVEPTEEIWISQGRIVAYLVSDMLRFLDVVLDIFAGQLRVCPNPECKHHRWFVATHPRQIVCSKVCAAWNKRQAQLRYWHSPKAKDARERSKRVASRGHGEKLFHRPSIRNDAESKPGRNPASRRRATRKTKTKR